MNFYQEWAENIKNDKYIEEYLSKSEFSREVFLNGSDVEVKEACQLLKSIPMVQFIESLKNIPTDRLPRTDEIPQCGTLEKAICEVPQALASAPEGLLCAELGLKLGADNHGDAPRKSGEGNGKLADAMDIAIRMKLPSESKKGIKYGYKLSSLGRYLLRFPELDDKTDIVSRLLIREYIAQMLIIRVMNDGYAKYSEITAALKSPTTRMRRRQNVRRIISFIDSQVTTGNTYHDKIDWSVEG